MLGDLHEECGVFGIWGDETAALKTYWGTFSLQHRGQESAGIAVMDQNQISVQKGMGLVTEVLKPEEQHLRLGKAAIGHVRYSTTGDSSLANAQPLLMHTRFGPLALAHNGNVVNDAELRQKLADQGSIFQGTTDSEILAHLIARSDKPSLKEALLEAIPQLKGGFAFVVLSSEGLYGIRDPYGIRPLVLGKTETGGTILASESCAIDAVTSRFVRDIQPGEMVIVNDCGVETMEYNRSGISRRALCAFEVVYFARPDSRIDGRSTHVSRRILGQVLAQEAPAPADVVVGVPDSSLPAAMGFAEASDIPFDFGLVKNRYIARTFIAPDQKKRETNVQLKLSAVREVVEGKRVVLVDDSLVRGTTSRLLVRLLRKAGAEAVHMRIASPPYVDPCHYGIDTSRSTELAARHLSLEELRKIIGADSLAYLSLDGLAKGLGEGGWCNACFGAGYPVPISLKEATVHES